MTYDPQKQHRRSIRLRGYDYAQSGAYAITIVAQDRACRFGEVGDGVMRLNAAGRMAQAVWDGLPSFQPGVLVDAFVVMPNHIHGIIVLVGAAHRGRPGHRGCPVPPPAGHGAASEPGQAEEPGPDPGAGQAPESRPTTEPGQAQWPAPTKIGLALGDIVQRFKTLTTKRYADGVKSANWPPFRGGLWQRNYYEHIVRSEAALDRLRRYIDQNPLRWESDEENPRRTTP